MASSTSTSPTNDATSTAIDKSVDKSSSDTNSVWRATARQNQAVLEQDTQSQSAAQTYLPTVVDSSTQPVSEQLLDLQQPNLIPDVAISGNNDTVDVTSTAQTSAVAPEAVSVSGNNDTVTTNESNTISSGSSDNYSNNSSSPSGSTSVNVNVNGSSDSQDGGTTVNVNVNGSSWSGGSSAGSSGSGSYEGSTTGTTTNPSDSVNVSGNNDNVNVNLSGTGADPVVSQFQQTDPVLASTLTDAQGQMSTGGYSQFESNVYQNWASGNYPDDQSLLDASAFQLQQGGASASDVAGAQNAIETSIVQNGDAAVSTFGDPDENMYAGGSMSVNVSGNNDTVNVNTGSAGDSTSSGASTTGNGGTWDGSSSSGSGSGTYEGSSTSTPGWSDGSLTASDGASVNVSGNNDNVTVNMAGQDPVIAQFQQTDPTLADTLTSAQSQMTSQGYYQFESNVYQNWASGNYPDDQSLLDASTFQLQQQGGSASDVAAAQNAIQTTIATDGDNAVSTFGNPVTAADPDNMNINVTGNNDTVNVNWEGAGSSGDGGTTGSGGSGSGSGSGSGGDGAASGYQGPPDYSTNPEMLAAQQQMIDGVQTLGQIQANPNNSQLYTNEAETDFSQAQTDLDQAAQQLGLPMPTQSALIQGDQNSDLSMAQQLAAYQGDAPGQTYDELAYDGRLASHEEQGDGAIEANGPQGDIFMQTLLNGQNNGQAGVFLDNPQDAQYFLQALTQSIGTDGQINGDFLKQVTADTYYAGTGTDIQPILNQQPTLEADNSQDVLDRSFPDPTQPGFMNTLSNDSGWNTNQIMADALWGHLQTSIGEGTITNANAASFLAQADSPSDFIDQPLIGLTAGTQAAYEGFLNSPDPGQNLDNAFLSAIGDSYGITDLPEEAQYAAGGTYV